MYYLIHIANTHILTKFMLTFMSIRRFFSSFVHTRSTKESFSIRCPKTTYKARETVYGICKGKESTDLSYAKICTVEDR